MRVIYSFLVLGLATGLVACGIGGPGDNNNNNLTRPEAGVGDGGVDAGNNNNQVPVVQHMDVQTLRDSYIYETLGQTIADLRPIGDCQAGHIPEGFCIPLQILWDGSDFLDNGSALDAQTASLINPLIFYSTADMGATVLAVAEASLDLGYTDVWVVDGGFEAWTAKGWYQDIERAAILDSYYTVDSTGDVSIAAGTYLIDTMDAPAYATGHIECAINIDGDDLWYGGELQSGAESVLTAVAPNKATDTLIFYCVNSGCAASVSASFAAEAVGYSKIFHYKRGYEDWQGSANPVVTGTSACGP